MRPAIGLVGLALSACADPDPLDTYRPIDDPVDDSGALTGPVTLANVDAACDDVRAVFPAAGEEGHRHAARLVPPEWPFRVERVRVPLGHGVGPEASCEASVSHVVELFVADGDEPPAAPAIRATLSFPPQPVSGTARILEADVDLALSPGEALFVAVRTEGRFPSVTCVTSCADATVPEGDWWSGAAEPPYAWEALADLGVPGNAAITAVGRVP